MHELGVVLEVVKTVTAFAETNNVTQIGKLVLQIGELSSMIPHYIEECYPMAVEGTIMEKTELEIEILPGNGKCHSCGEIFNLLAQKNTCPECGGKTWDVLSGREFMIKEIVAC